MRDSRTLMAAIFAVLFVLAGSSHFAMFSRIASVASNLIPERSEAPPEQPQEEPKPRVREPASQAEWQRSPVEAPEPERLDTPNVKRVPQPGPWDATVVQEDSPLGTPLGYEEPEQAQRVPAEESVEIQKPKPERRPETTRQVPPPEPVQEPEQPQPEPQMDEGFGFKRDPVDDEPAVKLAHPFVSNSIWKGYSRQLRSDGQNADNEGISIEIVLSVFEADDTSFSGNITYTRVRDLEGTVHKWGAQASYSARVRGGEVALRSQPTKVPAGTALEPTTYTFNVAGFKEGGRLKGTFRGGRGSTGSVQLELQE